MKFAFILALMACFTAQARNLHTWEFKIKHGLTLRAGEMYPKGQPKADIFYFHGFGDRLDNHLPLFNEWTKAGFRVISMDFPGHGESRGLLNNLDLYGFEDIIEMAEKVERVTRISKVPLFLAGWSTGGLLAVRAAQMDRFSERNVKGLVLMAPATTPHALVGVNGIVTAESLNRNFARAPHMADGEIKPKSPLFTPVFATKLLFNAGKSNCDALPQIPTLVIVADDVGDKYVMTKEVKKWAGAQRAVHNPLMTNVQCVGSYHELDNELEPVATQVRAMAAQFLSNALKFHNGERVDILDQLPAGPCQTF